MALGTSGRDGDTCTGRYAKWLEAEPPSLKCVCGRGRGGAPCLSPSSVGDHNRPSLSALPIHSLARGKGTGCQAEKSETCLLWHVPAAACESCGLGSPQAPLGLLISNDIITVMLCCGLDSSRSSMREGVTRNVGRVLELAQDWAEAAPSCSTGSNP